MTYPFFLFFLETTKVARNFGYSSTTFIGDIETLRARRATNAAFLLCQIGITREVTKFESRPAVAKSGRANRKAL